MQTSPWFNHPLWRRYTALVREDLTATYSRDAHKWLIVAPLIGIVAGIVITGLNLAILDGLWAVLRPYYYRHHWAIIPGLIVGFLITGLVMQFGTRDPNEHSTEEIIESYHEHEGAIDIKPFWLKLLAAVATVGSGGSAALEGPSIYGGGAVGSWIWHKLGRFGLENRDRRVTLISGAAAGMAAVFRAPLTGLVFALEMPYRNDLAHEALLPSLIASVVAYATLISIVGSEPLFGFVGSTTFSAQDLIWSAMLGVICGLVAMAFAITFRRARGFAIAAPIPHTAKLLIGGLGTALSGLLFVSLVSAPLMPLGPNYGAVREILSQPHSSGTLLFFTATKMAATIFTLGSGGVSAMFVPLLLMGGSLGSAFGQSVVHTPSFDLYAAVGMAAFIAAAYKTPLAAVVFVAETTGGHAYIIPSLIGAAVAYAVSGDASVSSAQRLHQVMKIAELTRIPVRDVMQTRVVTVDSASTLEEFAHGVAARERHPIYPVISDGRAVAVISIWDLTAVAIERWPGTTVGAVARHEIARIDPDSDVEHALMLLARREPEQMLLVTDGDGALAGIVTKTDILRAIDLRRRSRESRPTTETAV
jgi:CIC family chloride channel protein